MDVDIYKVIDPLGQELNNLGFRNKPFNQIPDVIHRVEITLRIARLYYFEKHTLKKEDKKWCMHYAQYVHFFDNEPLELLGELYFELTNRMERDFCFTGKPWQQGK